MTVLNWLRGRRGDGSATASSIRRELCALQEQRGVAERQRDLLALEAVTNDAAAMRWSHLDETVRDLNTHITILAAALPQAEAREAEAAKQAEAAARTRLEQGYAKKTADAQAWFDNLIARLPTGAELTKAMQLRDALRKDAAAIRVWSSDASLRRPFDPLEATNDALALRVQRIERSRWNGSHPITLPTKDKQEAMATAISRVTAIERNDHA